MKKRQDITVSHPQIAAEWDYEKNSELTITDYTHGSTKMVWWKCLKCGHSWPATINNRCKPNKMTGCPACSGRETVRGKNDLLTVLPDLCEEWDYENNYPHRPEEFKPGSDVHVGWICRECGYQWQAAISKRAKGRGCPSCAGKDVWEGHTDLATNFPDLVADWDFEKNEKTPWEYVSYSNKKVFWVCSTCGDSWSAYISNRSKGAGCHECAKMQRWSTMTKNIIKRKNNSIQDVRPDLAEEWNIKMNSPLMPNMYTIKSNKRVWWKCKTCGHEWPATVANRSAGKGCPECSKGVQSSLPEHIVFHYVKQLYKDALQGFYIAPYTIDVYIPSVKIGIEYDGERWHQDVEKDIRKTDFLRQQGISIIRIREPLCPGIADGSTQIVMETIHATKYSFLNGPIDKLLSILSEKTEAKKRILPNVEEVVFQVLASIAEDGEKNSIECMRKSLCEEWDYVKNNPLTPKKVPYMSNKRFWWSCQKCGHSWKAAACDRSGGRGCPACAGQVVVVGNNDLKTRYPMIAEEWDYSENDGHRPEDYTCGVDYKAGWRCKVCNTTWKTSIYNRTHNGSGCPTCAKTNRRLRTESV